MTQHTPRRQPHMEDHEVAHEVVHDAMHDAVSPNTRCVSGSRPPSVPTMIRLLLEQRFGSLPQPILDALTQLPPSALCEWAMLSARGSWEDIRHRLLLPPSV